MLREKSEYSILVKERKAATQKNQKKANKSIKDECQRYEWRDASEGRGIQAHSG